MGALLEGIVEKAKTQKGRKHMKIQSMWEKVERAEKKHKSAEEQGKAKTSSYDSSLGRYVFGSEISYNKAPPRLPGLGC